MITNGWFSYCLAVVEWFHQVPKLWLFCRPLHLQQANSGMGKSLGLRPGTGSQFPPRKLHAHVHGCHCLERLCWSVCAIKTNAVMLLTKNMVTNFKTYCVALAGEWDTKLLVNHISKHLEVRQKYLATYSLLGEWKCSQTRSSVFDHAVYYTSAIAGHRETWKPQNTFPISLILTDTLYCFPGSNVVPSEGVRYILPDSPLSPYRIM